MKLDNTKHKDKKKEVEKKKEREEKEKDDTIKREQKIEPSKEEDAESVETAIADPNPPSPTRLEPTEEGEQPLEIGDFLTPLHRPAVAPTVETYALDLTVGQTILHQGQPVEIIRREHTLANTGPLNSRHKVRLEVVALFDKERVGPLVLKGKEKMEKVVDVKRRRWCFVCCSPIYFSLLLGPVCCFVSVWLAHTFFLFAVAKSGSRMNKGVSVDHCPKRKTDDFGDCRHTARSWGSEAGTFGAEETGTRPGQEGEGRLPTSGRGPDWR